MPYASLRDFIARLETAGRLQRVAAPVSPFLEMTEIQTRLLAEGGPAVLFENVARPGAGAIQMPVMVNLFCTGAPGHCVALPGGRDECRQDRHRPPRHADLLAGRAGAVDHLAARRDPRADL